MQKSKLQSKIKKSYTIEELKKLQKEFDKEIFKKYDKSPEGLLFSIVALCGEIGEAANIVKKYYRKEKFNRETKEDKERDYIKEIKEELTDVFIYLLIFANKFDWDIEKSFLEKTKKNKKRF